MDLLNSSHFTTLVGDLLRQNHVPGLSVAVVHNDEVASNGFGLADLETLTPCTGDTLFDIASSAKSLTAASVALLVDDKAHPEVQYDALMSRLLPEDFVMQDKSYTDGVTVEDVLSHRTGMASHDSSYMGQKATHPDDAKSITRNLRNLKEAAPLRSRYLYCNMMYTVATHLVEQKSTKSFSDFLEERIFEPLHMNSTALQPSRAHAKGWTDRMATGHVWQNSEFRGFEPQNCPEGQGAGSVISSANDFIKWVKALLYQEGPVNARIYQGLTKMRSIVNPNGRRLKAHTTPANYAAGMEVYFYRGSMVVGHDGNIPGFASRFIFMPDKKFGAVVLGNSATAGSAATTIMRALMDEVLGVPMEDRPYHNKSQKKGDGIKRDIAVRPKQPQDRKDTQTHGQSQEINNSQTQDQAKVNNKDNIKGKAKTKGQNKGANYPQGQKKPVGRPEKRGKSLPAQETPLTAYVGEYWNAGYHTLKVEVKDSQLFVDATDRSMGFNMTFEHVKDQTEYTAHLIDDIDGSDDPIDAEFAFNDDRAMKLGLDLEPAIKELIWFERRENIGK